MPFAESVGALIRFREEGKIRHIGLSNVNEAQLDEARGMTEIVSVQNRYNLSDRRSEGVLERCEALGIAFLPWAPLAVDELAGPGSALAEVAARHGATPGQVALAWLMVRSPEMLPIPGTGSIAHLEENVRAAAIKLGPDEVERLGGRLTGGRGRQQPV